MRRLTAPISGLCVLMIFISAGGFTHRTFGEEPVYASPSEVGLSDRQLERVTDLLRAEVEQARISGAVALVARHGRVAYSNAVGTLAIDTARPMTPATVFRIASMTKPITSTAVMQLVDDRVISLDDPVSKFLPEFSRPLVLTSPDSRTLSTVRAQSVPTIRHLLTHTSGLTYGWFGPEVLDAEYTRLGINDFFTSGAEPLADRISRAARVPLRFQPGTAWDYGISTDVLARVVEVVSGLTAEQYFHERIFRPLGMTDTGFSVREDQRDRLAGLHTLNDRQQLVRVRNRPVTSGFLTFSEAYCAPGQGRLHAGGSGLVSTSSDYLRFLRMLLNKGELNGTRILSEAAVDAMTTNQIGDLGIPFPGHGDGFGYGFGVLTEKGAEQDGARVGTFSWGGVFNTFFWVDPQEQLIGILMVQLYPYDHLDLRESFQQQVYSALDDSGFEMRYRFDPDLQGATPDENPRQLRVNSAEASLHANFGGRSEARSAGYAVIPLTEDPRRIRRADLAVEVWGGHPGTRSKHVTVNGRSRYPIPEVGTASGNCTHQYPVLNLRPSDLVNGRNSLQFACDQGDTFWGHYIVDHAEVRVGLRSDDQRLQEHGLLTFGADVTVNPLEDRDGFQLGLQLSPQMQSRISAVHYFGYYTGFDENGDGITTDWHGMSKHGEPYGHLGSAEDAPFEVEWDTSLIPAQNGVRVRAVIEFEDLARGLAWQSRPSGTFSIAHPENTEVLLLTSRDLPTPFWSRAGNAKECSILLPCDPSAVEKAALHVVTWTGGAGTIDDYFTVNERHFPVAEDDDHEVSYSTTTVNPDILRKGSNAVRLLSDTEHHGIEVMLPGPALAVRVRRKAVEVSAEIRAESGNRPCWKITTAAATCFLDREGGGLAAMLDPDGNDWLSFRADPGSGAAGEYRGFPNAVYKEAGSYFHALNNATDRCTVTLVRQTPDEAVFSVTSDTGQWEAEYRFTAEACIFTMTKMPQDHRYWVLYEGTPGGRLESTDWWMHSGTNQPQPISVRFDGDIPATDGMEWMMFGDGSLKRSLVICHTDDEHPDEYYAMEDSMTVFGFGRRRLTKHFSSVPQSFAIGFCEESSAEAAAAWAAGIRTQVITAATDSLPELSRENTTAQVFSDISESVEHASRAGGTPPHKVPPATDTDYRDVGLHADTETESSPDLRKPYLVTSASAARFAQDEQVARRRRLERHALTEKGNPKNGEQLFRAPRTNCSTCHVVNGNGGIAGPDLSGISGKYDRPHLIESLLEPSLRIVEGYHTTTLVLTDGRSVSGVVTRQNPQSVTLTDARNQQTRIPRDEIEETIVSQTSIMPDGLADRLSESEFTDLIAYLETLRTGAGQKFGAGIIGPVNLPEGFSVATIATGISGATAFQPAPDGRIFVCEQTGALRIIRDGHLLPEPFVQLQVDSHWERGLIGVTVSPEFPDQDPWVYVVYVAREPWTHHRISRFRADGDKAVPNSEEILLAGDNQADDGAKIPGGHQGGAVHFGPDGCLYVAIGEHTANEPAQRLDMLLGKILRLNPDGSIPADNPLLDRTSGKYRSIWAYGCRNPFTFAFRKSDGYMLINDVGGRVEEINPGVPGADYGWPAVEHGSSANPAVTAAVYTYPQSSIAGGDFCPDSSAWPEEFRNRYFFADFVHGWIRVLNEDSSQQTDEFANSLRRPVDLRFAPDGSLFVLLRNAWVIDGKFRGGTGSLLKISPPSTTDEVSAGETAPD